MRAKVFRQIQAMPLAFFSRTQTGALISRLNNDVIGAQQAFTDLPSNVVGNLITVAIVVATMFVLPWQITLVAMALLPLFLVPARLVGPDQEASAFDDRAASVRDIGVVTASYQRIFVVALTLKASLATAFAYGWGGVQAVHGALAAGTVVALTAYLARLNGPLTQLSNLNLDVMTTLVSFERLFEVLDLQPTIVEHPDADALEPSLASVELIHVDFSYPAAEDVSLASPEVVARLEQYPRTEILHDLSLRIEPGTVVALVGPSGAGKTTISALVPRLYDVTSGSVRINGMDVRMVIEQSLRDRVGVVSQDPHLFHDTLGANLRYARPEASDQELWDALERAQIRPLVERMPGGLDTLVGDRRYRLSGGEKQRVALARLILKAPDIVVLDEATAHLDSESEAAVQQALEGADRTDRRARPARRPAGRRWPLRRALPHPVRHPAQWQCPAQPRRLASGVSDRSRSEPEVHRLPWRSTKPSTPPGQCAASVPTRCPPTSRLGSWTPPFGHPAAGTSRPGSSSWWTTRRSRQRSDRSTGTVWRGCGPTSTPRRSPPPRPIPTTPRASSS